MEIHLLKFTAALAILWLFYKLFLENDNRHQFKRYYLLASIFFALIVPFITVTEYIEATTQSVSLSSNLEFTTVIEQNVQPPEVDYLPIILWSVYGIGVLFFGVKFIVNLFRVFNKIRTSEKYYDQSFIYVLIDKLKIPHSFFSYIFLNKDLYKSAQIPKEVLIHEQTHAQQKHSIDILIMELLQIVFWFHPLIYIMKHSIKLNHEFLADKAVIRQGIEASVYQQLLLAFSSNASKNLPTEIGITSSINYSSIKKRFTVMKTQTSKTRMWLSTLSLLPIIAILFYNFSSTEYILKESPENIETLQEDKILNVVVNSEDEILINGKVESFENLEKLLSQFPKENYTVNFTSDKYASDDVTLKVLTLFTSYNIFTIKTPKNDTIQQKASSKEVEEYNQIAKKLNSIPKDNRIIKLVDLEKLFVIYKGMTIEQKEQSEPFPQINIYESNEYKMNLSESGANVKHKDTTTIILRPLLEIKEDDSMWLNGFSTSFNSVQNDFNKIVKNKKTVLNLKSSKPVSHQFINELLQAIGDNVITINVGLGDAQVYDDNYQSNISSQTQTIEEIDIHIDKDDNLFLNNTNIHFDNLIEKVNALNTHLSVDDKRKFLQATISYEDNSKINLAEKITALLPKHCNIFKINSSNIEVLKKHKSANYNSNPYAGKSLKQAKKMYENETYDFSVKEQKADSPWKISLGKVTYIEDDEQPVKVKITAEELKEYNTIVKKLNAWPEDRRIIKKVDFERISYIYFHLDEAQKKKAEPFPNFPPPPPKPENPPAPVNLSFLPDDLFINGKKAQPVMSFSKAELNALKLEIKNNTISSFSFKLTGQPIEHIKGFSVNKNAKTYINQAESGSQIQLFNFVNSQGQSIKGSVIIEILD